jgi:hypothetical protein
METLNDAQLAKFTAIVKEIPEAGLFSENGVAAAVDVDAVAEVNTKIEMAMKTNPSLPYGQALKQVMSENKGLQERYDSALKPASKEE